jgi:hypothetical protein
MWRNWVISLDDAAGVANTIAPSIVTRHAVNNQ